MKRALSTRFWNNVRRSSTCWTWIGCLDRHGYGKLGVNGKQELAHRLAWYLTHGTMPSMCVLHTCDNPPCVNPKHLFLGTRKDNAIDKVKKNRQRSGKGENHGHAKLTETKVKCIRTLYQRGNTTQEKLGQQFNIDVSVICRIVNHKIWIHV